jgi:hypothetical protein
MSEIYIFTVFTVSSKKIHFLLKYSDIYCILQSQQGIEPCEYFAETRTTFAYFAETRTTFAYFAETRTTFAYFAETRTTFAYFAETRTTFARGRTRWPS